MAKNKSGCELIIDGAITAKCSCGQWKFIGLMPEAKKVLKDIFNSHLTIRTRGRKNGI